MTIEADKLYVPKEVAEFLRCGTTNVYDLATAKAVAVTRIGVGKGGLRIKGSDLLEFLDARRTEGPQPKTGYKLLGL